MLPILDFIKDGKAYPMSDLVIYIASYFELSDKEKQVLIPSRKSTLLSNRVGWSRTYLKKANLVDLPKRGYVQITSRGLEVLEDKPAYIDKDYLKRFPEFLEFIDFKKELVGLSNEPQTTQTPEEMLEASYQLLKNNLAQDLLEAIKKSSPRFFEQLVIDLLLAMGYGGSRIDAGKLVGGTGDGGIDGIIDEDKLGLDVIYIQAKRWQGSVGTGNIRDFVGSLVGKKANKGVFITTSSYTKERMIMPQLSIIK